MATWVDDSAFERRCLQAGMRVRAADGRVLGRVARVGLERMYLRRRFSKRWSAVPLSRLERIRGADAYVSGVETEPVTREVLAGDIITYTHPLAEASGGGHVAA